MLQRSPVPDLLFEDIQAQRLREITPFLHEPRDLSSTTPLHRLTVFVTYACNLKCAYCKTIYLDTQQAPLTMSLPAYERLLTNIADSPLRHIHYTGGEAALIRDLPDMISLGRQRGAEAQSITTNGTQSFATYASLVENGLNEIRISIDARDPRSGHFFTGQAGAWNRSVETVRQLAAMRDSGTPLFIIANTVITEQNRAQTDLITQFLLDLGVDDLKLITAVQQKTTLGAFPEAASVLCNLQSILLQQKQDAMPLLRRKLQTVFDGEAIGLGKPLDDHSWYCYIPLTERTVDSRHYYPCSVYLREGGQPIGRVDEPAAEQRRKTIDFVTKGRCPQDPICQAYCLHCTREFNNLANAARRELAP
jgi:molybdenum cofactor biosynthesis enzyme MoaA